MHSLLSGIGNSLPSLARMNLSELLFELGKKSKISRYEELTFLSTIKVLSLPRLKLRLSPRKSSATLISKSVDVEDEKSGGEGKGDSELLKELLLWIITSESVFLAP